MTHRIPSSLIAAISAVLLFFSTSNVHAQQIIISGRVMDVETPQLLLEQVMVINLRTQTGGFADAGNRFSITAAKNDTIIVTALGYSPGKLCFRDSALYERYEIIVPLRRISIYLKEATIFVPRSLSRIEEDFSKLGYDARDFRLSGINAWQSPITALYQEFSRKERSKRRVAELMNDDRRRELLREVLANYSRSGLINLPYNEYNAFIDYLGLNDFLLKTFSQYELALYIKNKYYAYMEQ